MGHSLSLGRYGLDVWVGLVWCFCSETQKKRRIRNFINIRGGMSNMGGFALGAVVAVFYLRGKRFHLSTGHVVSRAFVWFAGSCC